MEIHNDSSKLKNGNIIMKIIMYISIIMAGCCENSGNIMHYVAFPREIFFLNLKTNFLIKL